MIEIRQCTFDEIARDRDFESLRAEYAAECSPEGLPPPTTDMETYRVIERGGFLRAYGAFREGVLVGFAMVLTSVIPHYGRVLAVTESLFVARAHRKTGAGVKLLRAAERHAREVGSPGLMVSAPSGGVLASVLPSVGYRETNRAFLKRFDGDV